MGYFFGVQGSSTLIEWVMITIVSTFMVTANINAIYVTVKL